MALLKKCKCDRSDWGTCQHAWYDVHRENGRQVYTNLGRDQREAVRAYRSGNLTTRGTTLAEVGDRWLAVNQSRWRASSYGVYRHGLGLLCESIGDAPVGRITTVTLQEVQAELLNAGFGLATVRKAMSVAGMVLRFAEDDRLIERAPNMRRVQGMAAAPKVKHLSPDQMVRVLDTMTPQYRTFFHFGYLTGMRPGELLAIGPDQVQGSKVHVVRQVNTNSGRLEDHVKTARSRRKVDLTPQALRLLEEAQGLPQATSDRYWTFSYRMARDTWADAVKRAGVPTVTPHALRHSNASLRLSLGQDIVYVADQLGHATSSVTLTTYAHLIEKPDRDLSAMDAAIHAARQDGR